MIPDLSGCAWERAVSSKDRHTPDSTDRGHIAQCEEYTGACMWYPLDRTVDGKAGNKRVAADFAVFWPKGYDVRDMPEDSDLIEEMYPFDPIVYYPVDHKHAHDYHKLLNERADLQTIPLENASQMLYCWTKDFPSESFVKDGTQLVTYGYIWTSTAEQYVWRHPQRLKIVLPRGKHVEAFVDPQATRSGGINCDGTPRDSKRYKEIKAHARPEELRQKLFDAGIQERHHNDVILGPSVFTLIRREVDWDLVEAVLETCKREHEYLHEYLKNVERRPDGWYLECEGINAAWVVRSRLTDQEMKPYGATIFWSAIKILSPTLVFIEADKVRKSPVLVWESPSVLAPDYDRADYSEQELNFRLR